MLVGLCLHLTLDQLNVSVYVGAFCKHLEMNLDRADLEKADE